METAAGKVGFVPLMRRKNARAFWMPAIIAAPPARLPKSRRAVIASVALGLTLPRQRFGSWIEWVNSDPDGEGWAFLSRGMHDDGDRITPEMQSYLVFPSSNLACWTMPRRKPKTYVGIGIRLLFLELPVASFGVFLFAKPMRSIACTKCNEARGTFGSLIESFRRPSVLSPSSQTV